MMHMKKIFVFLSILLLIYSIFNIFNWFNDSNSIAKESEEILNTVVVNDNIKITEMPNDTSTSQSSIDFTSLEQINSDVVRLDTSRWYRYKLSICTNNR